MGAPASCRLDGGPDDGDLYSSCARHDQVAAAYRCCECGKYLCEDCIEIGSHLLFCRLCGERAIELDDWQRPLVAGYLAPPGLAPSGLSASPRAPSGRAPSGRTPSGLSASPKAPSGHAPAAIAPAAVAPATPSDIAPAGGTELQQVRDDTLSPATTDRDLWPGQKHRSQIAPETARNAGGAVFVVNHAVIPAATIAMVSALLFFLLDVRSVFLLGTEALKWVGFCFATATVLIARYGHMSSDTERQGCYKLALAAVTLAAMTVLSARASSSDSFLGLVANLLIIAAVWRFATRVTNGLSMEGNLGKSPEPGLYGLERLRLEAWRREHGDAPDATLGARGAPTGTRGSHGSGGGNPGAPVARLAAIGIVAFALGEPFLLSGPPAVGKRALGAMIVFLLASGVVLAAGSALGLLRRVRSAGGQASLGQIPGRIAAAGLVMVTLLSLALAIPGIEYRGTGDLRPPAPDDGAEDAEGGDAEGGDADDGSGSKARGQQQQPGDGENESAGGKQRGTEKSGEASGSGEQGFSKAASSLVGQLAELGKWLRYVVLALGAALALWGLWHLLTHLGSVRRWLRSGLGGFFRRLLGSIGGFFRRRRKSTPAGRGDPFADLQSLRRLEPRQAVIAAYNRLLAAFELLEHGRSERHTPYEFLASIPAGLKAYAGPAKDLTEVYVRVAYGTAAADGADRRGATAALEEIKALFAKRQT